MLQDEYTILWGIWAFLFAAIEGAALFNKKSGDTLSEHIWAFIGVRGYKLPRGYKWRRGALYTFLTWLVVHLTTGAI